MSITKDFETRKTFYGPMPHYGDVDVEALLAHTRALEAMLKKNRWQWNHNTRRHECLECCKPAEDCNCQLAKLLDGVE